MAIDNNKPVHLFNQLDNKWYMMFSENGVNKAVVEETPSLTQDFAGIGTREITESGI
jgi:hypothetical protein